MVIRERGRIPKFSYVQDAGRYHKSHRDGMGEKVPERPYTGATTLTCLCEIGNFFVSVINKF
jgi:hypothetical protein